MLFKKRLEISKKELIEDIIGYLCEQLPAYTFEKGTHSISKTIGEYTCYFILPVSDYNPYFYVQPHAYIANEQVSNIVYEIYGRKGTDTPVAIGGNAAQLLDKNYVYLKRKEAEYLIDSVRSLKRAKQKLLKDLKKMDEHYFGKFCNLEQIHQALNRHPREETIHFAWDYFRRKRMGIIVAKLVNAPNYYEIADTYRKKIVEVRPDLLEKFEVVFRHLESPETANKPKNNIESPVAVEGQQSTDNEVIDRMDWHLDDKPENASDDMAGVHIGYYLAWIAEKKLIGETHHEDSSDELAQLRKKEITGQEFLIDMCDGKFWFEDLNEQGLAFTQYYYQNDTGVNYLNDFAKLFEKEGEVVYEEEEFWKHYKQLKTVLNGRYGDWVNWCTRESDITSNLGTKKGCHF